jgi:hypothetical protein
MAKAKGRPRKNLDREKLTNFIAQGYTVEWVAHYFGVHHRTLYENYSACLREGRAVRDGSLQHKQYSSAIQGNTALLIWLGKQWLKQREPQPPPAILTQNILVLSDEQRERANAIVKKLRSANVTDATTEANIARDVESVATRSQ